MRTMRTLAIGWLLFASCSPPQASPPAPQHTSQPAPPTATAAPSAAPSASPSSSALADPPPVPRQDAPVLPAGFVSLAENSDVECLGMRVQTISDPVSTQAFLRVTAGGRKVYEVRGRSYQIEAAKLQMDLQGEFCGDMTGDGIAEIAFTERTLGAHCCYTHHVVSMTTPPKTLLMWEKGDAGTPILPVKYRDGPSWQLEGLVVMWPPFNPDKGDPALSYATAPLVPVVFSLQGGALRMTSLSFPQAFRKHRDTLRSACAQDPQMCDLEIIEWIDSIAIGDWNVEKQRIQDADLRTALERTTPAMKRMMAAKLGSESRPAPTKAR